MKNVAVSLSLNLLESGSFCGRKMEKIVEIYHGYALLIGMTSYRVVNGRLQQTKITRAYALSLNILTVSILPMAFWNAAQGMMMAPWLPDIMFLLPFVLYSVNYTVVVYILISRCYRDSLFLDLAKLTNQLNREMVRAERKTNSKLLGLLYIKSFTLSYLCLASLVTLLKLKSGIGLGLLINIAYSFLNVNTYLYFTSFWQVVRGYDFVNQEMKELLKALRCEKNILKHSEVLRVLWSLHSDLSIMARRINRVYGLQMMVSRTDYVIFTIIYGYIGIIYVFKGMNLILLHAGLIYLVRTADFFLNDFICDLISRYQCFPKHEITEGEITQQVIE